MYETVTIELSHAEGVGCQSENDHYATNILAK